MHAFPLVVAKYSASVSFRPGTTTSLHTATASATWWPTCLPRSKLTLRLHVPSQTFFHDATVVPFAKRHWDLCLCAQFLQIVDPPQATEEKSHSNKKKMSLFFVKLPVLFLPEMEWWCESVAVCSAALSSEIKSSVCEINDLLSLFVAAHGKSVGKLLCRDYIW